MRRAEREHLGATIEAQEEVLFNGLDPLEESRPREDDRLADRIAGLLVQRARVERSSSGAVDEVVAAALLDEVEQSRRTARRRLAGEPPPANGRPERHADRRARPQRRSLDRVGLDVRGSATTYPWSGARPARSSRVARVVAGRRAVWKSPTTRIASPSTTSSME